MFWNSSCRMSWRNQASREDFGHDMSVNVGEPAVYAAMPEAELFVIDPEQVEDRGVKVVAVGHALDGFP